MIDLKIKKSGPTSSLVLILGLMLSSCVQNINSSSGDQEKYSKVVINTSTPEGQRLAAAYGVISQSCISCHSATMNLSTDAAWLNSGYIVPGQPNSSILYCRIIGSGCGAEDMPKETSLPTGDLAKIKVWIENIK